MPRFNAIAVVCLALGCERSADQDPDELARMHRSIDSLREAKNPDKRPVLEQLRSLSCTSSELCELKRVCAAAYTKHLDALGRARALGEKKNHSPATFEQLEVARRDLVEAEALAQRCVTLQAELREASR